TSGADRQKHQRSDAEWRGAGLSWTRARTAPGVEGSTQGEAVAGHRHRRVRGAHRLAHAGDHEGRSAADLGGITAGLGSTVWPATLFTASEGAPREDTRPTSSYRPGSLTRYRGLITLSMAFSVLRLSNEFSPR